MGYTGIAEEELKNLIAKDFFAAYDCTHIIGKIDFTVAVVLRADGPCGRQAGKEKITPASHCAPTDAPTTEFQSLLWAEAKRGIVSDIYKPLVQLVLTIGRARTFDTYLPPPFLGVFDAKKIVFLPYKEILPFFALNDFNWNVTPSDDSTREFGLLYEAIRASLEKAGELYLYRYDAHAEELRAFIQQHFSQGGGQIQVNKNNFVAVYQRWLATVQPSIAVDWALLKKQGIIDGDFFLADLLSEHNQTLKEALYVLLQDNRYVLDRKIDAAGLFAEKHVFFKDKQRAHTQFWSLYQRPPREEYWGYIIDRRDLLVPQDVRERKGSFFTPRQWVELSQQYIADVLGENWQEEYYVWDCAAGTGNLLNGLTNKYNIWASTLDPQDVQVMKDRIANGANLLESHVFQFDFLNDEFSKLPAGLQEIVNDPEKRRKLVVYINPPYVEATNARTPTGSGENRAGLAREKRMYKTYVAALGKGVREIFVQFMIRIYNEISSCHIAMFSTLKILQAQNFVKFRKCFLAKLEQLFLVPANTFDNVQGKFPIGFYIWNCEIEESFSHITANVYDAKGVLCEQKQIRVVPEGGVLLNWLQQYYNQRVTPKERLAYMVHGPSDFQHSNDIYCTLRPSQGVIDKSRTHYISLGNLLPFCMFLAIRHCVAPTWLNNQDQFLYPRDGWQTDTEFQTNCLAFTLFHGKNNIQSQYGTNHWIPFTEAEVEAKDSFESHFMTQFIQGRLALDEQKGNEGSLFQAPSFVPSAPLVFSPEAVAVFDAGRELWRYYHAQPAANPNASYYDIRAHFQGRNDKGKMNAKSDDAEYMRLWGELKEAMEALRQRIVPKVYAYGFLIA